MTTREKDKALAEFSAGLRDASSDALTWVEANRDVVGGRREGVMRSLKKQAVEARKIARAAERPISIGVFGPSQHGKSFLINTLLSGREQGGKLGAECDLVFGSGPNASKLNFLADVAPQGDQKETTGLVTRFTLSPIDTPPGYPVSLRIMREVDIVKILANTFTFDLKSSSKYPATEVHVSDLLNELETKAAAAPVDNLRAEDLYELEEYFDRALRAHHHPYGGGSEAASYYWSRVDRLIPRLKPADRARALAPLWGDVDVFTNLYLLLKNALDQLNHVERVFAPLDAISDKTPGRTVLHVETATVGLSTGAFAEPLQVVSSDKRSVTLPRSVVAALSLELALQMQQSSWSFMQTSDLLDFPGARKRHNKSSEGFFNDKSVLYPLGEAFLRGKVAVLFDSYAAEFDLTTLVACHRAEQSGTPYYDDMIDNWIKRNHGATPEQRIGKPVRLHMATTFCDRIFEVAAGSPSKDVKIGNNLAYIGSFCASISEWTPNRPFSNSYLIRNPLGARLESIFECIPAGDDWIERERPEKAALLEEYRTAFHATSIAKTFFDDADETWQAMVRPNDGGVRYLGRKLESSCTPDIKYDQIASEAQRVAEQMHALLDVFFEHGDIADRVRKRVSAIQEVVNILATQIHLVPRFTTEFQVTQELIRQHYLDYKRARQIGGKIAAELPETFGQEATNVWTNLMLRRCGDSELAAAYRLTSDQMRVVANELLVAAKIAAMPQAIDAMVYRIEGYAANAEQVADQMGTLAALYIGEFVSRLGRDGVIRLPVRSEHAFFSLKREFARNGEPVLPPSIDQARVHRDSFIGDWLKAVVEMTRISAASSGGATVDIEQNERLGRILAMIKPSSESGSTR
ncbi:MAG TPA: virulence factor SrfC family protein [Hyphomonadaceae bacterium]|nr:virulence factor SrfC family protein [Hyphomonadaceae bacterium]